MAWNSKLPQRALITGASSGIGRAVAEVFARHGMEVGILSEKPNLNEETVGAIRAAGGSAFPVHVDLSKREQLDGLIERIEGERGPIGILVNNAGMGLQADITDVQDNDLYLLFQINFFATVILSRDIFKRMAGRGGGKIINVSSASARRALPGMSIYASSKAAMHAFSQALRIEGRPFGIQVTEVLPMSVRTPFFDNARNLAGKPYQVGSFSVTAESLAERIWNHAVLRSSPEVYTSSLSRIVLGMDAMNSKPLDYILTRRNRRK